MNEYDIIKRPLLTEKSSSAKELNNQYCFEVDTRAKKMDIKRAVEKLFSVKVTDVRTMQYGGKKKRVGKNIGVTKNWKKAIVTLKDGNSIELFEGV